MELLGFCPDDHARAVRRTPGFAGKTDYSSAVDMPIFFLRGAKIYARAHSKIPTPIHAGEPLLIHWMISFVASRDISRVTGMYAGSDIDNSITDLILPALALTLS